MSSKLRIVPIGITAARAYVEQHHSHHHAPVGGLAAVSIAEGDRVVCVAMLSRPVARLLQADPHCAEVNRVASDGSTAHAASMAIGAISRAAVALGYRRLVSYTILGEHGTSYRAAGWWPVHVTDVSDGWMSHPRTSRAPDQPQRKVRWEFGPDAKSRDAVVDSIVRESAGKIELRQRPVISPQAELFRT